VENGRLAFQLNTNLYNVVNNGAVPNTNSV
jgi:hypothetical protein